MTKQTTQKTPQNTSTRKVHQGFLTQLFKGNKILWAGLVFFSIPLLILAVILLQSSLATGKVIEGNRFNNDLDPEITKDLISTTQTDLEGLDVLNVEINLHAATLLVTLQVDSTVDETKFADLATSAVEVIDQDIPLLTYFTSSDSKKMYDLQIDVYNLASDNTVNLHTILTKNANMLTFSIQDVSTAVNPELAAELIAEMEAKNNPVESTETTIPTDSTDSSNTTTTGQ